MRRAAQQSHGEMQPGCKKPAQARAGSIAITNWTARHRCQCTPLIEQTEISICQALTFHHFGEGHPQKLSPLRRFQLPPKGLHPNASFPLSATAAARALRPPIHLLRQAGEAEQLMRMTHGG